MRSHRPVIHDMTIRDLPSVSTHPRSTATSLRAACRLGAILAVSAVAMPLQALLMLFTRGPAAFVLPRLWHRCLCAILGLKVEVVGAQRAGGSVLHVGNHLSHFDILLVGSVLPARFIAKDDMQRWPGVGFIAGLQQTIFVSRKARDAPVVTAQIADAMRRGSPLVLFAEGTTSSGVRVAPFKSSLFAPVIDATGGDATQQQWQVQPFTLELLAVDGHAVRNAADRDHYAYYGDMDAAAHVREFLRGGGAHLRLHLHAPIAVTPGMSRKALATLAYDAVASALPSQQEPA